MKPYQLRESYFCLTDFKLKCSRYRIVMKTVVSQQVNKMKSTLVFFFMAFKTNCVNISAPLLITILDHMVSIYIWLYFRQIFSYTVFPRVFFYLNTFVTLSLSNFLVLSIHDLSIIISHFWYLFLNISFLVSIVMNTVISKIKLILARNKCVLPVFRFIGLPLWIG